MTSATLARLDQRGTDLVTVPRATLENSWLDVQASAWEARRDIGSAYQASRAGKSPTPRLVAPDRRLMRLTEFARRQAGEAAGISYISPNQMPLFDGCLDGDQQGA